MSKVVDLSAVRNQRAAPAGDRIPKRDADIELQAWIEGGEVAWLYSRGDFLSETASHGRRTAAMIDMAWLYGYSAHPEVVVESQRGERPLLWWMLSESGEHIVIRSRAMTENASWRHAWWLAKQWWRLTMRCARIAWAQIRGRQP